MRGRIKIWHEEKVEILRRSNAAEVEDTRKSIEEFLTRTKGTKNKVRENKRIIKPRKAASTLKKQVFMDEILYQFCIKLM